MKCTTVIDKTREEEVVIFVKKESELAKQIERFVQSRTSELIGFGLDREAVPILPRDVTCFIVEDGHVQALTDRGRYRMRERLYEIEERLDSEFIKINQSCIANVSKIKRFDASVMGSLTVIFNCGYRDYVSRRQLKSVKEKIGLTTKRRSK